MKLPPFPPIRNAFYLASAAGFLTLLDETVFQGLVSAGGVYLGLLGASAGLAGTVSGAAEFLGISFRAFPFHKGRPEPGAGGFISVSRTILSGSLLLLCLPLLFFTENVLPACFLIILAGLGRALRQPLENPLLSFAASETGKAFTFGLQKVMASSGAVAGPGFIALLLAFTAGRGTAAAQSYRTAFAFFLLPSLVALLCAFSLRWLIPENYPGKTVPEPAEAAISPRAESRKQTYLSAAFVFFAGSGLPGFMILSFRFSSAHDLPAFAVPAALALAAVLNSRVSSSGRRSHFLPGAGRRPGKGFPLGWFLPPAAAAVPFLFFTGIPGAAAALLLWAAASGSLSSFISEAASNKEQLRVLTAAQGAAVLVSSLVWGFSPEAFPGFVCLFTAAGESAALAAFILLRHGQVRENRVETDF